MSDDVPGERTRPQLGGAGHEPPATPDSEAVLSAPLKAALMRELGPSAADRARNRDELWSVLAAGTVPATVQRVDAAMAARAAEGIKPGGLGQLLANKLVISSLVLASAVGVGVTRLPRATAPRATQPEHAEPARALPPPVTAPPVVDPPVAASPVTQPREPASAALQPSGTVGDVAAPSSNAHGAAEVTGPARGARSRAPRAVRPGARQAALRAQPAAAAASARAESASGAPLVETSAVRVAPSTTETTPAPPHAGRQPAGTLAAELALIRAAATAIDRREHAAALGLLQQYGAHHPRGALRDEAEALRAIALCAIRDPGAAAAREAFTRTHAGSALDARVRRACTPSP